MATKKEATVETQAAGHESSEHDVRDAAARGYRKARRGYVVSDKMDKTIVVEVEDRREAPRFTARSSAAPRRSRRTMRRTPPASATWS